MAPELTGPQRLPVSPSPSPASRPLLSPKVKLLPLCVFWPPVRKRTQYPETRAPILTHRWMEVEAWVSGLTSLSSQCLMTLQVVVGFKLIRLSKLELWGLVVLNFF